MDHTYDLLVVGGGINGCGIARDAAGRGYSVLLVEQNDLASGTSSAATKLIHGGLRYLEHYEFRLVREALIEREVLWKLAPHIVRPLRFVLPYHRKLRPAWLLRTGLFLYDHIGGRKALPPTRRVQLADAPLGRPLRDGFRFGYEYSDCWVDDARLVVLNAIDAAARGADIRTRTQLLSATRDGHGWTATLRDADTRKERSVRARFIVNAAGPWVSRTMDAIAAPAGVHRDYGIRLVQGSHIVVPRLYEHHRCYFFQNGDGRIFFAIPYEDEFTLIGTTDHDYGGDPAEVRITDTETAYLIEAANGYFSRQLTAADIVWSYSGVRPLFDDGASAAQQATRDYVLKLEAPTGAGGALHVLGGKLTTYRRLAESALTAIEGVLGARGPAWTANGVLPGGDIEVGRDAFAAGVARDFHWLPRETAMRLATLYGTRVGAILTGCARLEDMGRHFGAGLYQREVDYLTAHEWARSADDIVRRRTKLLLRMSRDEIQQLEDALGSAAMSRA